MPCSAELRLAKNPIPAVDHERSYLTILSTKRYIVMSNDIIDHCVMLVGIVDQKRKCEYFSC